MYKIVITEKAVKDLKNIDKEIKKPFGKENVEIIKKPLKTCSEIN